VLRLMRAYCSSSSLSDRKPWYIRRPIATAAAALGPTRYLVPGTWYQVQYQVPVPGPINCSIYIVDTLPGLTIRRRAQRPVSTPRHWILDTENGFRKQEQFLTRCPLFFFKNRISIFGGLPEAALMTITRSTVVLGTTGVVVTCI